MDQYPHMRVWLAVLNYIIPFFFVLVPIYSAQATRVIAECFTIGSTCFLRLDRVWHQMIPSPQSSESAIALARRALDDHNGRFWHGHATGVDADFYELGLLEDGERYIALDIALQEIGSGDRMGPQPPNDFSSHRRLFGSASMLFVGGRPISAKRCI